MSTLSKPQIWLDDEPPAKPVTAVMPAGEPGAAAPPTRDGAGRFLPGNRMSAGHGRPRKPNLLTVAQTWAAERGTTVQRELARVVAKLVDLAAEEGNVHAARLLFEYLADDERPGAASVAIELTDVERTMRLRAILTAAAARPAIDNVGENDGPAD